jgi:hypothetical protein
MSGSLETLTLHLTTRNTFEYEDLHKFNNNHWFNQPQGHHNRYSSGRHPSTINNTNYA